VAKVVRKPQVVQAQTKEVQQEHWEQEEEMDTILVLVLPSRAQVQHQSVEELRALQA
jgi:hypothetical protein